MEGYLHPQHRALAQQEQAVMGGTDSTVTSSKKHTQAIHMIKTAQFINTSKCIMSTFIFIPSPQVWMQKYSGNKCLHSLSLHQGK